MRRRPAVVVSSSLSKMVEQSCLLGWRRRVHHDEECYVVVHCGLVGAWIYLSSEMAFRIEGSLQSYYSWYTSLYAMRNMPNQRDRGMQNNVRGERIVELPYANPNPARCT